MNSIFRLCISFVSISLLAGCAHSIRIAPDTANLPVAGGSPQSSLVVGYFISDEERSRRVITPGGGGDKVEYAPYNELEAGLYRVLRNVFADVRPLKSAEGKAVVGNKGIALVFRPTITTRSSSDSLLTWPPTDFGVTIDIKAADSEGKVVWEQSVSGNGNAQFAEFRHDFSLAAKRASEAALKKLQSRMQAADMSSLIFLATSQQARQGDPESEYNLANMYFAGTGIPADVDAGMIWLGRAAKHGNPKAQYALGERYLHGEAVAQDEVKAEEWLRMAKQQGNTDATRSLALLSADQRGRAEAAAAQAADSARRASAEALAAGEKAAAAASAKKRALAVAAEEQERLRKRRNTKKLDSL